MIRFGLCCIFREQPIRFSNTTAMAVGKMPRSAALAKLSALALANARALGSALEFCAANGIGCFRIGSQILPLKTHPQLGYEAAELPESREIVNAFKACRSFARKHDLRLCFHPDQFVVLNSRRPEVVAASLRDLEYQAEVAEWVGADVINIHAGGAFGDKAKALADFARALERLSQRARRRLTVENDDKLFTPCDLLPICRSAEIPLVYDVHHHRCNGDGLSVARATEAALETWKREPLFHISSPIAGWTGPFPARHHDYIDLADFPRSWRGLTATVEIEAKAKELAVLKLKSELARKGQSRRDRDLQPRLQGAEVRVSVSSQLPPPP